MNIAFLGVASLKQAHPSCPSQRDTCPTMSEKGLNSESSIGSVLALRLPPTTPSGLPPAWREDLREWLDQVCHAALRTSTRDSGTIEKDDPIWMRALKKEKQPTFRLSSFHSSFSIVPLPVPRPLGETARAAFFGCEMPWLLPPPVRVGV